MITFARRIVTTLAVAAALAGPVSAQSPDGAALYTATCAMCHDTGAYRAPSRDIIKTLSPEAVVGAMNIGPMKDAASDLSRAERRALAEFLTGKALPDPLLSPTRMAIGIAILAGGAIVVIRRRRSA
jgi:cytochrome c5